MSKALYRKYRPRALSEIIGQDHITAALQNSIQSNKISHAYLLIGPRGTGKTSIARIIAHEINQFPYELEDEYLDIIEIDAASNTGVDNIRSLREKAIIAPTKGKYKIYIIDEVHMLSKSAFNALLKTLEEPPAHVVFIMATTDAHKVPLTITSRSQTLTFKLADPDVIVKHLSTIAQSEHIDISDDALKIIARRGGGSFRDSISLLDQVSTLSTSKITASALGAAFGLPSDELISQLLSQYSVGNLPDTHNTLKDLLNQGVKPEIIAEELISKIIHHPEPYTLSLLEKLTNVPHSNYPEVKLLIALLNSPAQQSSTSQPTLAPVQKPSTPPVINPQANSQPTASNSTPAHQPAPVTSWPELLAAIKKDHAAVHSLLAQTTTEFTADSLKIYSKSKMIRDQISKKSAIIAAFLPENTVIEVSAQKPSSDPVINDLSSILGPVEEIDADFS